MSLDQLKMKYIQGIYQTKALLIQEECFTLQSGKKSHIYLNHRNFLSNTTYLSLIATLYHELTKKLTSNYVLGAVESIMSPIIVGAMSVIFNKNFIVIQKKPMSHGTQAAMYGDIKNEILLVDDMTSTGDTLIDAAEKIRTHGGIVKYAVISAYREDTALCNLRAHAIEPISIASFEEIINQLFPTLTPQEQAIVKQHPFIID